MSSIHYDYETTSLSDITKVGAYRYAADPSTRVLMFAVAEGDGEPMLWRFDQPDSAESLAAKAALEWAIMEDELVYAHNYQFELAISHYRLAADVGIPRPPAHDKLRCTQAMCRRAAIPESLGKAAEFLKLDQQKENIGKALIKIFSDQNGLVTLEAPLGVIDPATQKVMRNGQLTKGTKPKSVKSASPILDSPVLWDWRVKVAGELKTVREAWELFCDYCRQDVRTERELHAKLGKFELTGDELASFQFDLRMNFRGVPVNLPALRNAQQVITEYQGRLEVRMEQMCGLRSSQGAKLQVWLRERGFKEDNLQADTVEALLANPPADLTPLALEVLRYRSLLSFSAIKKIPTMLDTADAEGLVRGTTVWHGARTGRATGRIIQPQNMKKATIKDSAFAYRLICDGFDLSWFEDLWDSPLEVMSSCCRHFIQLPDQQMLDADYVGVEARIAPWLAGETEKLQSILDGVDQYKSMAADIVFNIPYESVTKDQRTVGKPIELSCIAEGQLVLTPRGEVPIENIELDDLVWDGVEWVSHEGLIYQGIKEVITYQGLTATPDHKVFTEELEGPISFGGARRQSLRLRDTRTFGASLRELRVDLHRDSPGEGLYDGGSPLQVWDTEVEPPPRTSARPSHPMSSLHGVGVSESIPQVVSCPDAGGTLPLRGPFSKAVQRLWGAWHPLLLCIGRRGRTVDDGDPRAAPPLRGGSYQQRRALRAGEPEMVHPEGAMLQHADCEDLSELPVSGARVALQPLGSREEVAGGADSGRDSGARTHRRNGEAEELANYPTKVRVYDLLNAGPRHRFTVSGKLVSNCVYGTGGEGLLTALRETHKVQSFLDMPDKVGLKTCNDIVKAYRDKFPQLVQCWRDMEDAAKKAIRTGESTQVAEGKLGFGKVHTAGIEYLVMRLPSGRRMYYPRPEIKAVFKKYKKDEMDLDPWKKEKGGYWMDSISFYGKSEQVWCRIHTWGSRLFENACQAIGADLLNYGCIQAESEGYPIFMIVHDQALCADVGLPLAGYREALCRKQPWAETFPLEADANTVPFYLKD